MSSSFASNGLAITLVGNGNGGFEEASSVAVRSDGKIVVAGRTTNSSGGYRPALVRYNADGSVDTTFIQTDISLNSNYSQFAPVKKILLKPDGSIILIGAAAAGTYGERLYVARYGETGTIQGVSFLTSGTNQSYGSDAVLLPDGSFLVAGLYRDTSLLSSVLLARFTSNGQLDSSFGSNGFITSTFAQAPGQSLANSIAIQGDGKVLVAGAMNNGNVSTMIVARYQTDGSADTSFGNSGVTEVTFGTSDTSALSVLLQSTGKIVVAGVYNNGSGNAIAVARLNVDGSLDSSFGTNGKATLSVTASGTSLTSAVLSSSGDIFVAGNVGTTTQDGLLVKFTRDGILDTSFGVNGVVITDFGSGSEDVFSDVALQADGKVLAVGRRYLWPTQNISTFAVARYNSDGSLDRDYIPPTAALLSSKSSLGPGETATISFILSEAATDFLIGDVTVTGGTLGALTGSGTTYTATLTPTPNSTTTASISVASNKFSDAAGNYNTDGSDANNTITISVNTVQSGGTSGQSGGGASNPICFAKGTHILTQSEEVPVEVLATASTLQSQLGGLAKCRWIGYQRRTPEFAQFQDYLPVKISAGALDDYVPLRDLYLSPDHAVLVDGHLVHAKALVNGKTIVQMTEWAGDIEYYHIETEAHEIIYAEGVPCETFIDNVSREQFDNYAEYQALYPNTRMMKELPLPRVKFKRQLPTMIKQRLESRITELDRQHKV